MNEKLHPTAAGGNRHRNRCLVEHASSRASPGLQRGNVDLLALPWAENEGAEKSSSTLPQRAAICAARRFNTVLAQCLDALGLGAKQKVSGVTLKEILQELHEMGKRLTQLTLERVVNDN